eukprot:TRINITY_DN62321_c0_g1_i1.p1 TRINITY_DN62321_c0_g1~~TRINITY_DN62321_c0_g1_i1.p1  ORF type:complete len:709 (-),score=79.73 TRINITY_DN62321_c0_g1_i1:57-2093(-)
MASKEEQRTAYTPTSKTSHDQAPEKRRKLGGAEQEANTENAIGVTETEDRVVNAELVFIAPKQIQSAQTSSMAALRQSGTFCDVLLMSSDRQEIRAHAVVLAASTGDRLRARLVEAPLVDRPESCQVGKAGLPRARISVEVAAAALCAALDYIYTGEARVPPAVVPELLRIARRWEIQGLYDVLVTTIKENLSPELVAGLFALGEPLGGPLGAAAYAHLLSNFAACATATTFVRWPPQVLELVLRSDDLNVTREEDVLAIVGRWCRSTASREGRVIASVLEAVRWPLLSLATLDALCDASGGPDIPQGSLRVCVGERCTSARAAHLGGAQSCAEATSSQGLAIPKLRKSYVGWWAGQGCSVRGGAILAGVGAEGKAGETSLKPRAIRPHEGTLLFVDSTTKGPGNIIQWFVRAKNGRVVVGPGSELTGVVGKDFEEIADVWSGPDDAFYVLDRDAEHVVRVRSGEGELVGHRRNVFKLQGSCALAVGGDRSVYVLESWGSRVLRYSTDGRTASVAGSAEPGAGPSQLNAGLSGRIFVTQAGHIYISDTGNHRVQRWDPGAREGITVAGGRGCGAGVDQLSHPGGIWVLSNGTFFVADTGNHRIMRWRDGSRVGIVVAGGCGSGDGPHQLREPVDVAVDSQGALLIADLGNGRVMRWPPPAANAELLAVIRGGGASEGV